jgi:hypothetical protein
MKIKILLGLASLILNFHFCFAQKECIKTPIHILKLDVLKSAFCQLHFNYEFYNGKRLGEEIGFSYIYPNRIISFINEEPQQGGILDRTAGHYSGYGLEFRQKIYFPQKHINPYMAFVLSYKYKYCNNAVIRIDDSYGSSPSYETVSSRRFVYAVSAMFGFVTSFKRVFLTDISAGVGLGYFDILTSRNDNPQFYHWNSIRPGHSRHFAPVLKCGVKLGFGFKNKMENK